MYNIEQILRSAVGKGATDAFILSGSPVAFKISGEVIPQAEEPVTPVVSEQLIHSIYEIAHRPISRLIATGDDDFAFFISGLSRFRISAYKQRGTLAAVIRVISFAIPDAAALGIPERVIHSVDKKAGLVLVTGPAGSGKSTTLSCMIDYINATRGGHIITLEDPIEYLHKNKRSIVSQREISLDTGSYVDALRACLRQAPDVILVGEMRDFETIQTVMTAAETGHLVISTLHTIGAADTIDRIVDVFEPSQQRQIRVQLAMLLQSVISQQLLIGLDGKLHPAFEIMHTNTAIRTMIRESKTHQLDSAISAGADCGMITMDAGILSLVAGGVVSPEVAMHFAGNAEMMERRIAALAAGGGARS
ncbi:MAG TPA: PilT/PilU family type 4a pilus ATPase [Terriglobales bacterium]|nr:PilT/PilU family type 4a pilus ATPase [Terriglobales bacterium]